MANIIIQKNISNLIGKKYILGNETEYSNVSMGHFLAVEVKTFEKIGNIKIVGSMINENNVIQKKHTEYINIDSIGLYVSTNKWLNIISVEKGEDDRLYLLSKSKQNIPEYDLSFRTGQGIKYFKFVATLYLWIYGNKYEKLEYENITFGNNQIVDNMNRNREVIGNVLQDDKMFSYYSKIGLKNFEQNFSTAFIEVENMIDLSIKIKGV